MTLTAAAADHEADSASFRDPRGTVFVSANRVLRRLSDEAFSDYEAIRSLLDELEAAGRVIRSIIVDVPSLGHHVLEHPRLPIISYPYEWCFAGLREAALAHLDLQLDLLSEGFVLDDASAFNMQFEGARPVFIDLTSIRRYAPGEYWGGYRQFCEQFLYPLLLTAQCGVPFQPWYRGRLGGIDGSELKRLLPKRSLLSPRVLMHVHLHAALEKSKTGQRKDVSLTGRKAFPRNGYLGILRSFRNWIADLRDPAATTQWSSYEEDNSYASPEAEAKLRFIKDVVADSRPAVVLDLGCNSGRYSEAALEAGASLAVGLDGDSGALARAFERARTRNLAFHPLLADLTNLSPAQGWAGVERSAFLDRVKPDAVIALAVVHHLTFGASIPLPDVMRWLTSLGGEGVVEFVPPADPMVHALTGHRDVGHLAYSRQNLIDGLTTNAVILKSETITAAGRELFHYRAQARK